MYLDSRFCQSLKRLLLGYEQLARARSAAGGTPGTLAFEVDRIRFRRQSHPVIRTEWERGILGLQRLRCYFVIPGLCETTISTNSMRRRPIHALFSWTNCLCLFTVLLAATTQTSADFDWNFPDLGDYDGKRKIVFSSVAIDELGQQYLLGYSLVNSIDLGKENIDFVHLRLGILDREAAATQFRWRFTLYDWGLRRGEFSDNWRLSKSRASQAPEDRSTFFNFHYGYSILDFDRTLALESSTRYLQVRAGFGRNHDRRGSLLFLPEMQGALSFGSICFGDGLLAAFEEKAGDCILGVETRLSGSINAMLWQHLVLGIGTEALRFLGPGNPSSLAYSFSLLYLSDAFPERLEKNLWEIGLRAERSTWFMDSLEQPETRLSLLLRLYLADE